MLEYLKEHSARCEYNPNPEMVYDIQMHGQEYEANYYQQAEIEQLRIRLNNQEEKVFNNNIPAQQFENKIMRQQSNLLLDSLHLHQLIEISDPNIFINATPKWQELCNLKDYNEGSDNILEIDGKSFLSFAQSFCALEPANPCFKIKLLNFDYFKYMAIGFTSKGHPIDIIPGLYEQSVGCDSSGDLMVDRKSKKIGTQWKVGDVIECGIKFPKNFRNNESVLVKLYFTRNDRLVAETKVIMPRNGYFPTVYIFEGAMGSWWHYGVSESILGTPTKVKYFE